MAEKKLTVLGSTGSIGVQTLEVAAELGADIIALTANCNVDKMEEQVVTYRPLLCAMQEEAAALELEQRLRQRKIRCEVLKGEEGVLACAAAAPADICVAAIVGIAGLLPVIKAISSGKQIALANKETLVTAGEYITALARQHEVEIFPVDSEHSAIFQCLAGNRKQDVKRLVLTASGGPFRGCSKEQLKRVTAQDALRHPTWNMGAKITIDSATLMNKGLEVIEAAWLFGVEIQRIQAILHPQSIIHSMVEFRDGAVLAQMGTPDMRLPIGLALTWPNRMHHGFSNLDLLACSELTFEEPDVNTFRCLALAYEAFLAGGIMPAVMNGANEVCVDLFLQGRIEFLQIAELIEETMQDSVASNHRIQDIHDVIAADAAARQLVYSKVGGI